MSLSPWQRAKRRWSLLGGSYEHPDGTIEFDFEVIAGIEPGDSEEVKEAKLRRYYAKQRRWEQRTGAMLLAIAGILVVMHFGMTLWDAIGVGVLIAWGTLLLTR